MNMRAVSLIFLLTLMATNVAAQESRPPGFAEYAVSEKFGGSPAPAKIQGKWARLFRTRIRLGAQEGPNFAGHYTLVTWGCGSDCILFAIVDARSGRVYTPPSFAGISRVPSQEEDPLQFRIDSRLLIIAGSRVFREGQNGDDRAAKFYYKWAGGRLVLLRRSKLKFPYQ